MDSLSIFSLILSAGFVVQMVMLILILMSIYSWTLILSKKKILIDTNKNIKLFHQNFSANIDLEKLAYQTLKKDINQSSMERIFSTGFQELTHTTSDFNQVLIIDAERAYRVMNTMANNEVNRLDSGLSILAMIASSSPYIGLFGTVWGIMHSFIGLASVKQATVAIVAPGIAEALIATAFGLFAAIPATIAYNRLISQVESINNKYTAFVEQLFVLFQRQNRQ
ncbi:Cell division and transport-associated protein TolQ [Candidatus Ruthia magnifica str. Cm (Calyptogena magnifica)]|uniref:Cell division and transport-associated protein TolQ n=1 Tax=Ruthia magnifica subsp. Calyptogena magnifica TaxID=413404 RepID=A1AWZ9_RUTMC|nr:protein TolQ [Candidatus Ruthturnera calyptogenae]ABL02456.1 Cell division and transport-associated protein TolQ [Candidatus Ruthia magnifica str. Cm (Calyptogena magnifica)]